jgi:hypothetical protein
MLRWEARIAAGLAITAAAFALGACGGSNQSSKPATAPAAQAASHGRTTKATYIRRLDALCAERRKAIARLSKFEAPADYARHGRELIAIERKFVYAVGRLALPAEHRAIDHALAKDTAYLRLLPRAVDAARRGDPEAGRLLRRAQTPLSQAADIIHGYGSKC